jgi:hypothetical protein
MLLAAAIPLALAMPARAETLAIICTERTGDIAYYVDMAAGSVTTNANSLETNGRLLTFPAAITDRTIRWAAFGQENTIDRYSGALSFRGGGGGIITYPCRLAPKRAIE